MHLAQRGRTETVQKSKGSFSKPANFEQQSALPYLLPPRVIVRTKKTLVHVLGRYRPSRMKPKRFGIFFDFHHLKPCCLQAITKSVGNDRHEGVAHMNQPHKQALQAIGTDKIAARLQDAPNFAEKLVLEAGSVHMVQHREANGAGELCVCEWHLSGIALDDLNVAGVQTRGERFG